MSLSNQLVLFFIICVALYGAGAVVSVITYSNSKWSNRLSNTFALTASSILAVLMLYKLIFGNNICMQFNFKTNIPFLSIKFNIDNLSAFFILIIAIVAIAVSLFSYTYMSHYFTKKNVSVFGSF
ncbi:MAG TPA: hydrogenase 4 subunit B, partial [Ruminiclostridium sp.]|nr:hydrogenase 4 subunit B [Ruminiclostridium sp.]